LLVGVSSLAPAACRPSSEPRAPVPGLRRLVARDLGRTFEILLGDTMPVGELAPDPVRGLAYDTATGVQLVDEPLLEFLVDAARAAIARTFERDRRGVVRARWPADVDGVSRARGTGPLRIERGAQVEARLQGPVAAGSEVVVALRTIYPPTMPEIVTAGPRAAVDVRLSSGGVVRTVTLPNDGTFLEQRFTLVSGAESISVTCENGVAPPGDPVECELARAEVFPAGVAADPASAVLRTCEPAAGDCAEGVLRRFLSRAWGRAPSDAELARYVDVADRADRDAGLQLALAAAIVSPNTLFLNAAAADASGRSIAYANAVAHLLVDAPPDRELLLAAADGSLATADGARAHVSRLVATPGFKRFLAGFAAQWLAFGSIETVVRSETFPLPLRDAMHAEAVATIEAAVRDGTPLTELVAQQVTYADARVARHYGLPAASGTGFVRRSLEGTGRAGLVTLGASLATNAYTSTNSVTLRGRWLLARFVCAAPPSPPALIPESMLVEGESEVQSFARHRSDPACIGCHALMDPVGFTFGVFGTVGEDDPHGLRPEEPGRWSDGRTFTNAAELARIVATDDRLPACVVRHMFTYALGREPDDADHDALSTLTESFKSGGMRLDRLVAEVAVSESFRSTVELRRSVP